MRRLDRAGTQRAAGEVARGAAPSCAELARGFCEIGLLGFGGVLPWARRMVVEQRRWLTPAEFTDLLALCQFLPGPNVVNLSVALGARFQGVRGALVALAGLLAPPVAIVIAVGALYERYAALPIVHGAFVGLAAAASGLVVANAAKIAWPLRREVRGVLVAVAAFAALALLRLPLLPTLAVLVPVGIVVARARP
jgi:chromate transporter